ncbi:hypothetical protein [Latilactobacillus sakei]|uniref:Uncharacterized protein n=2 Tax=Latilactobacillus sakei TaxID=1599 RepID=A0AAF0GRM2_LATSK|nr:hypothetical protein [Latilactobacillus sakei]WGI19299.1 hypothetical protein QBD03_00710 [Latilactobacillus sakei]
MKSIEDYIKDRKRTDGVSEFDTNYLENQKIFNNYVADYFIQLKNNSDFEEMTVLEREKLSNFEKSISKIYSEPVVIWLRDVYLKYNKKMNIMLSKYTTKNPIVFFISDDLDMNQYVSGFIKNSIKKMPYIYDMNQEIGQFFREFCKYKVSGDSDSKDFHSQYINDFSKRVWDKYSVNINIAVSRYLYNYCEDEKAWPDKYKIRHSNSNFVEYRFSLDAVNLLGINDLFLTPPVKKIFKGNKEILEYLLIYYWIHEIDNADEKWEEYLSKLRVSNSNLMD